MHVRIPSINNWADPQSASEQFGSHLAVAPNCGLDFTATGTNAAGHIDECGGFSTSTDVQVGSVHHDAVTEQQWVVDVPGHWE